ncbi:MAG TPA: C-terminal binding protein [Stellaceae bacterium]|jgi:C-terminal binding protein|nr:C-terminal binding protein [Stellaceae bacterium]
MPVTVLYPEARQQPDDVERNIFGPDVRIIKRDTAALSELSDADCAEADGLMIMGFPVTGADLGRFKKLRAIVRMGVGYDKLDRPAAAQRNVLVCNVPDYGTTEVADHAIALALTLRRGILLHHEHQRHDPPAPWRSFHDPLIQRLGTQTFGIVGLGRIGTAVALRAKAFNFRVVFYDPKHPNGTELGLGIERAATLEDLLRQTNTLSIHAPLTTETKGLLAREQLSLLPQGAVVINDARGPIVDLDALHDLLKSGHIAGAGLDVLPVEPPVEPVPELLRAYRAREKWLEGRLVITPHSAWLTPHSEMDTRRKSAETMRAALLTNNPQNVITPDMF